ncbi:MAG: ABC transporter substrate-binding protein [Desulfobacterales bacterium]|nr:ABC transporter substrate-binding protein [Desulfobacterales bacterium]
MQFKRAALFVVAMLLFGLVLWFGFRGQAEDSSIRLGDNPNLPTLTFYTSGLATTPQIPLWYAATQGKLLHHCNLEVKVWKTIDDLRGTVLAGKGDLWLGHTEDFIQAALRGAPVKLLAVTAWRKFYLVSTNPHALHFSDYAGKELAYAPTGSPAVPIIQSIVKKGESIRFQPGEPKQLAMRLIKGDIQSAVVPEPLVSMLQMKVEGLRVGENVESLYGKTTDSAPRMPIAGLAIHTRLIEKKPELVRSLLAELKKAGEALSQNPEIGIASLPKSFQSFIQPKIVKASLSRDLLLVKGASDVQSELVRYVQTILPDKKLTEKDVELSLFK